MIAAADLKGLARRFLREPVSVLAAVLIFACGIAAFSTGVSVARIVILRAIPVADLDDVHIVATRTAKDLAVTVAEQQMRLLQRPPFDADIAVGAISQSPYATLIKGGGFAGQRWVEPLAGDYAAVFRLHAQEGRWLTPDDDAARARVAVVSDRIFREWFGGDRSVVGTRSVVVGQQVLLIVGVAPASYQGLRTSQFLVSDLWMPLSTWAEDATNRHWIASTGLLTFVRPFRGHSVPSLEARFGAVLTSSIEPSPRPRIVLLSAAESLTRPERGRLAALIVGLSVVILVGAALSLSNAMCARHEFHWADLTTRVALGATRRDVFGLVLAETAFVCVGGLAVGVIGAFAATTWILGGLSDAIGPTAGIGSAALIQREMLYGVLASVASAGVVALLTSWRLGRTLQRPEWLAGRRAMSRADRVERVAVTLQVAGAVVLTLGAGCFAEEALKDLDRQLNVLYDATNVAVATVDVASPGATEAEQRALLGDVTRRLSLRPGVETVAVVDTIPGRALQSSPVVILREDSDRVDGRAVRRIAAGRLRASPEMFRALRIPIVAGRGLLPSDVDGAAPVAVLSQSAASALWGDEPAVGRVLVVSGNPERTVTVVGVMANVVQGTVGSRIDATSEDIAERRPSNMIVIGASQSHVSPVTLLVRGTTGTPSREELRAAVSQANPDIALIDAGPMSAALESIRSSRVAGTAMVALALSALAISMMGVYGTIAALVGRKRRDFAIRLALGASPGQVGRGLIDHTLGILLRGMLVGVFVAAVLTRVAQGLLFGLMPNGVAAWVAVPVLLLTAGLLSVTVPVLRAMRSDPNVMLRNS